MPDEVILQQHEMKVRTNNGLIELILINDKIILTVEQTVQLTWYLTEAIAHAAAQAARTTKPA